jgi:hypothetical protein
MICAFFIYLQVGNLDAEFRDDKSETLNVKDVANPVEH